MSTLSRPSNARISQLCDMLCMHIAAHRTTKALLIAQYLRDVTGFYLVEGLSYDTGRRQ